MKSKIKIAVLIEQHYDHDEWIAFTNFFRVECKTEIIPVSHLWGQTKLTFYANGNDNTIPGACDVTEEINNLKASDFAGILRIGGYAADRLRYEERPSKAGDCQSPAARFIASALVNPSIVVATLCHGLWLLTAMPSLIKGRSVTCAPNIVRDVQNAGANIVFDGLELKKIVADDNLITASHPEVLSDFMKLVWTTIQEKQTKQEIKGA